MTTFDQSQYKRQCPDCKGKWADRDECPFCLVFYGEHVQLRPVTA